MKAGLSTSILVHGILLTAGLVSLSSPRPLESATESVSVETISETELAELVQGARNAPQTDTPTPEQTAQSAAVEDAQNIGNNTVDLPTPPRPQAAPREIRSASAPPPSPPTPPQIEPVPQAEPEPAPAPTAEPEPVQQPVAEAPPAEPSLPESTPLPSSRPQPPERRPQPPQPTETARAEPERQPERQPERREQPQPESRTEEPQRSVEDEIAALLDRRESAGGGARRQTEQASLGASRTNATRLSASELGALRDQLAGCWSVPAGAQGASDLRVSVSFNLNENGKLQGTPQVASSSGNNAFDQSAIRAIQKCDVQGLHVPSGKYDVWNQVTVNFDPSDMLF